MSQEPSTRRVAMAKRLARKWLSDNSSPEYRLTIYRGASKSSVNLPSLLRSFREGRIRIGSAQPIPDLGVKPGFDYVTVRSSNYDALLELDSAVQSLGCDTSGVF